MKIFLDSYIISCFLRGELNEKDEYHLETIFLSNKQKKIELITLASTVEKIFRIPELNKTQNIRLVLLMKKINPCFESSFFIDRENDVLQKVLSKFDNIEGQQIYQSIKNKCDYFLTLNSKILDRKEDLLELKFNPVSPFELVKIILSVC